MFFKFKKSFNALLVAALMFTSTSAVYAEGIEPSVSTTITLQSTRNPAMEGEPVALAAKVQKAYVPGDYTDPTGTITFKEGETVLGTAPLGKDVTRAKEVYFSVTNLSAGEHQITAVYNGDSKFIASTSGTITQTVSATAAPASENPTITEVTSWSSNPSQFGQAVTFDVTTNTAPQKSIDMSGSVILMDGDTELATIAMYPSGIANGKARGSYTTSDLSVGDHPITAKYFGDTRLGTADSISEPYVQHVIGGNTPPTPVQTTGTVTGRVYGDGYGWIDGASVTIGQIGVTTNAQGEFTLSDVPSGAQTVTASAYGYADHSKSVTVPAGQSFDAGTITLYAYTSQPQSKRKHSSAGASSTTMTPTESDDAKVEDSTKPAEPAPSKPEAGEYQDPNDIFRSRVVDADSNVIAGVEARTAEILRKGDDLVTLKYDDVDRHWSLPSVEKLTKLGVLNGYPDGGFEPDSQITRAEFAAMIDRAFVDMASRKVTLNENDFAAFSDIYDHWSADHLKQLIAVGVLTGYEDGTIRPEKTISRQEMALMITRVLNASILNQDTSKVQFTDLDEAYGADAIKKAAALGIFDGKTEHTFDPSSGATRAESIEAIIKTYSLSPALKESLNELK